MRPEFFRDGICGRLPNALDLPATHVHPTDVDSGERGLDFAYCQMQAEVWSPNGEARELIEAKGLQHTSMSVGDVIVDDVGNVHVVATVGFKAIGGAPHLKHSEH
jgi:hypothetical protein